MALSARALELSKPDPKFLFWEILQDIWEPTTNPDDFVSLGLAENTLMHDTLRDRINGSISLQSHELTYGDGKKRLKAALCRFWARYFDPIVPIEPPHITITNGCSSAVEHLAWAIGNPGDLFLLGRPYYYTFVADVTYRMSTHLRMVDFDDTDPLGMDAVHKYEERLIEAQSRGEKVAGIILSHPHNPLGRCYPPQVIIEFMKLCQRYQIHLISDEIYALSTFSSVVDTDTPVQPFKSVLSIDKTNIVDPALVHVLWGVSKDFGANGLRLGAIISQQNPTLHAALIPVSLYSSSSSIADHVVASFLDDETWVDSFIEINRLNLARNHKHIVNWAQHNNIPYAPGVNSAFFLWINLGAKCRKNRPNVEADLDEKIADALLQKKVFLAAGVEFGSEQPGWFRIVFSQERAYLDEGLRRISAAIQDGLL